MSWSYRLLRTVTQRGTPREETTVAVHEVYYDELGAIVGWTKNPVWPSGATWLEFQEDFARYLAAAQCSPSRVLNERDLPGYAPYARRP